ncbi:MAG: hypothetical protein NTY19_41275 [Planctomycetota bacterium]|nr:hypothetical protein [Planctomycetota bacterium]
MHIARVNATAVAFCHASFDITSQYPYGYRCQQFGTFFFNVCNGDDGHTWSTEWVIDDPAVYCVR